MGSLRALNSRSRVSRSTTIGRAVVRADCNGGRGRVKRALVRWRTETKGVERLYSPQRVLVDRCGGKRQWPITSVVGLSV